MKSDELVILEVPFDSHLFKLGCQLRCEVFVQEQGVSLAEELDGKDSQALHWVALQRGNVIGVLRALLQHDQVKIGRFAVNISRRNQGVGTELIRHVMAEFKNRGHECFFLEAQVDRVGFYEKLGFVAFGETYLDAGILHRAMKNY